MVTLFNIIKPIKFDKVLLWAMVLGFFVSFLNISCAYSYWGEKECEEETIDSAKLIKNGYTQEETVKMQEMKKAEYEFCLARNQLAAKQAKDNDLSWYEYPYASKLETSYIDDEGGSRSREGALSGIGYGAYTHYDEIESLKKLYPTMTQNLIDKAKAVNSLRDNVGCGPKNPHGCKPGEKCYKKETGRSLEGETNVGTVNFTEYDCFPRDEIGKISLWREAANGSADSGDSFQVNIAGSYTKLTTDSAGNTTVETNMKGKEKITNAECNIQGMRQKYQSSCYSCIVIKTLITTFMDACSNVQDITTEAGTKILQLGLMIWLAFFALKNVTSLTNVEPGSLINTLFTMLFKCFVAYVFITSGITAFMMYIIEPIMDAGASYGIGLMKGSPAHLELTPSSTNVYAGTKVVSASLINNIMGFTESLDKTVSTNLIIGHSLTCHSTHAGMWRWAALGFEIRIPNFWIWLCGAAIWFCGFMLTLGVSYYMLDISFKLGFSIIAFPIVAALWPFNITKDKLKKCVSIIMKSAATFAMLALTSSYALSLISESLRDLDEFYRRVEAGDSEWISNTFDVTGSYFIIILFAYLYSMKLISSTIPDYVNKFFPDGVFKSDPMHQKLTQVTDMAKKAAVGAASFAGGVASHQAGKVLDKGLQQAAKGVRTAYNKFKKKDGGQDKKDGGAGDSLKRAGTATKNTGKAMEQTGKMAEQTGKVMEKGGKAASQGGGAMFKIGTKLSGTGLGAIVGVPMMIAGGAVKAAGVTTEYAGKATAKVGQVMKKAGKTMKKVGEKMEKAGEKMQKMGKGWKSKGDNMGKKKEGTSDDSENSDQQQ